MSDDPVVVSYHESLLRKSDVDLLRGPYWLNDTLISFYFEHLERSVYASAKDVLLFVAPQVTQCLKMVDGRDFGTFLEPLNFAAKDFAFFALNDNDSPAFSGGMHWSLLVFSRNERTFFHLDSMSDRITNEARTLYNHFVAYLEKTERIGHSLSLIPLKTLQQSNGYDCGIHVLCNVDMLAAHILKNKRILPNCPMAEENSINTKRDDLLKIIDGL